MAFRLPIYRPPVFDQAPLKDAPLVRFTPAPEAGVAPDNYHATTIFPEYYHLTQGSWVLLPQSRMDGVVVRTLEGFLRVKEFRHLRVGESVACGRGENGEEGIYVHTEGFAQPQAAAEKFAFRTSLSRETAFSIDYDELYELLCHEREHGFILWVLGPAAVFDRDARLALVSLIQQGYVHGLLAGNALATHDIEAALCQTALGQDIYTKRPVPLGQYKHYGPRRFLLKNHTGTRHRPRCCAGPVRPGDGNYG